MNRLFQFFPTLLLLMLVCMSGRTQPVNVNTDTARILFVGNSFTYFYNLSQVVAAMAEHKGIPLVTRQSTVGGSTLEQHWNGEKGTRTRAMIDSLEWDYVVFNNHSMATLDDPEKFRLYCSRFAALVREQGAEPVFMETWAYKANPLMLRTIGPAYRQMSQEINVDLVPCGQLFDLARKERPDLELFFDEKHPSYNATYMIGLAFFKYFTGLSTDGIPRRLTTRDENGEKLYLIFMHQEDADFLQQLVDEFDFQTRE